LPCAFGNNYVSLNRYGSGKDCEVCLLGGIEVNAVTGLSETLQQEMRLRNYSTKTIKAYIRNMYSKWRIAHPKQVDIRNKIAHIQ
jgi:hypothetical protein